MYFLSILCVILLTVVMGFLSAGSGFAGPLFDVFSMGILVALLLPLLLSAGLLKDFNNAFRLGAGKRKAASLMELKKAKEALSLAIKILLVSSLFITGVQGTLILYRMDSPSALGPMLGVVLLSMVYGVGVSLVLLPLEARLNLKMQEFISEKE